MSDPDLLLLKSLVEERKVRFGTSRSAANTVWSKLSRAGRCLNGLSLLAIPAVIATFYWWGWVWGLASAFAGLVLYPQFLRAYACEFVFSEVFRREGLFDDLYFRRAIFIHVPALNRDIRAPADWAQEIRTLNLQ